MTARRGSIRIVAEDVPLLPLSTYYQARGQKRRHAVVYCRTAVDPFAPEHDALAKQEQAGLDLCKQRRYQPVKVIKEIAHGMDLSRRKGLDELRTMLRERSVDVVVVTSEDRLCRGSGGLIELANEIRGAGAFIGLAQ